MRFMGVFAFGLVASARAMCPTSDRMLVNDEQLIACYNTGNGATWLAGRSDFFDGMTFREARSLMGARGSGPVTTHPNGTHGEPGSSTGAPAEFDARTAWPGLIHEIRNQQQCGSCWAFGTAEAMGDRVSIALGRKSPVLSPEDLVSCDQGDGDNGCRGGFVDHAWAYVKNVGLLTEACLPYTAGRGHPSPCPSSCTDGSVFTRVQASSVYAIHGVESMQSEIMTQGPITLTFVVYHSFTVYKSGVYSKLPSEEADLGGHAVKALGWGSALGTDYWLIANSWDTTWGESGYVRFKRGADECYIETWGPPYAGAPAQEALALVV